MFFVSYTLNHGDNNLTDHWLVVETAKDAAMEMEALKDLGDLHCAAWGPIHGATEPQWLEPPQAITDRSAFVIYAAKAVNHDNIHGNGLEGFRTNRDRLRRAIAELDAE